MSLTHQLEVVIPFATERQASIALQTVQPDPELKPDHFSRRLRQDGTKMIANFSATSDRTLRVGVNSFMDNMNLVVECLEELDPANM